jgi:regulator of RNase E activity RraA
MPGDVVLGTLGGIIFIPPHLVKEVLEVGDRVRLRDEFGKLRLKEGKYTSGQIDGQWSAEIDADFQAWQKEQQK